jgi:AraC family transcriptional regulator
MHSAPATELVLPGFHLLRGEHAGGTVIPRHTHDDASLCYVFDGRFTEHAAGLAFDCGPDTLKLTVAGEPHSDRFLADESQGLRVDIALARFADSPAVARLLAERLFRPRSGLRGPMARIRYELGLGDEVSPLVVEGLLLELLALLARERSDDRGVLPAWLERARDLVESLYTTGLTLAIVAREVEVSDTRLARAWRRAFGSSIGERVRSLRIERAERDLRTTDDPISEIAARCGFYDQSHFTNAFRRARGLSPARFRLRARGR